MASTVSNGIDRLRDGKPPRRFVWLSADLNSNCSKPDCAAGGMSHVHYHWAVRKCQVQPSSVTLEHHFLEFSDRLEKESRATHMAELEALVVAEHSFRRPMGISTVKVAVHSFRPIRIFIVKNPDVTYFDAVNGTAANSPWCKRPNDVAAASCGTQLQTFKSVGRNTHAQSSHIRLDHGAFIHVTVVAENAAELKTVVYSVPVLVDLTPPVISDVKDGSQLEDLDYQNTSVISLYWDVRDKESGVDFCDRTIDCYACGAPVAFGPPSPSSDVAL
ncbi:hypothetical protein Bbelb_116870 [Branchiostoma belcheri]|nr:hypothetical protein Bbelb_116870 [Branchiostoma belcheri]